MRVVKWISKICGSLVIVFYIGWFGLMKWADSQCDTEISDSVKSPNGLLEATVFHIGCGTLSTSENTSLLAVRKSGDSSPLRKDDAVFAIDDYGALPSERYKDENAKLSLKWFSDKELQVGFPKGPHKLKAEPLINGVSIQYLQTEQ